jgi:DNA-binding MarR family transcriptional regulator
MRRIKLSGRERSVLRAIGFGEGASGSELLAQTSMPNDEMTDVLNALLAAGYVESKPHCEQVRAEEMPATAFEVNPGYIHELRDATARAWI